MSLDLTALEGTTWDDLTEQQPMQTLTPIERCPIDILNETQKAFRRDGIVAVKGLIPNEVIDEYVDERMKLSMKREDPDNFWGGWRSPTPYMHCQQLRTLATFPNLIYQANALIGGVMAPHLTLTGFVSTERQWHGDSYLNEENLWSHYIAAWIALDDIHPDSGPFEFVRGSHKWPTLRKGKLFGYLTEEQQRRDDWPTFTQDHIAKVCEAEIAIREAKPEYYIPKKGDVMFWHSGLLHRGSKPRDPGLLRKSLIVHFSEVIRRYDMKNLRRDDTTGMLYFSF